MSYQILARKWRPKIFDDVIGQEHILSAISNSLLLGRIHHSYLFSGTHGVGKTSIARLLSKGLNCQIGITATPCNMCNNCNDIEKGRFFDLIEIDAASRTKVEDILDLLNTVQYAPVRGRFKIYLIDEVHMLSRHSFNALLKTLEEPVEHVKFLLATTEPQKLPVTVLSRCLQFHLKRLNSEQIFSRIKYVLNAENIIYELSALHLVSRAANGSLRDAFNLIDQAIASDNGQLKIKTVERMLGSLNREQAISFIESIVSANGKRTLLLINEAASCGIEWETLLIEILILLHHLAKLQVSHDTIEFEVIDANKRLQQLARILTPTDIQRYYRIFLVGRKELPFAPDRRIGVEMTLLRALTFRPCTPLFGSKIPLKSFDTIKSKEILNSSEISSNFNSSSKSDMFKLNTIRTSMITHK